MTTIPAPLALTDRRRSNPGTTTSSAPLAREHAAAAIREVLADPLAPKITEEAARALILWFLERMAPDPDDLSWEDEVVADDPAHDLTSAANKMADRPSAHHAIRGEYLWESEMRLALWTLRAAVDVGSCQACGRSLTEQGDCVVGKVVNHSDGAEMMDEDAL